MKRVTLLFALYCLISCSKNGVPGDPIGPIDPPPTQDPGTPPTTPSGGYVVVSGCTTWDVPAPAGYTATNVESQPNGYNIFPDINYDKGWKQGYNDAVFYGNYYQIANPSNSLCNVTIKHGISDPTKPGNIRYEPSNYNLKPGEQSMGMFLKSGSCDVNWMVKSCVLWNASESKALRLQYEFNKGWARGKSPAQVQFDNGRYDGFIRGITQQPLSTL